MKYFTFLMIIIVLGSCLQEETKCERIVALVLENSINRAEIDPEELKDICESGLEDDKIIWNILALNNVPHSFYIMNGQYIYGRYDLNIEPDTTCNFKDYNKVDNIGYISVPGLNIEPSLSNQEQINMSSEYISNIQKQIQKEDGKVLDAWLIDLSNNHGGNMWPMLIALEPFFDQKILGHFIYNTDTIRWQVENEEVYSIDITNNQEFNYTQKLCPKCKPYTLKNDVKIAVLISHQTSSSGEAAAITLQSLDKTTLFGCTTSGFATANQTYQIEENELLVLTTSEMANDDYNTFPNGIHPNYQCINGNQLNNKLSEWLKLDGSK